MCLPGSSLPAEEAARPIIRPESLTPETDKPFHPLPGPATRLRFSDAGGLTPFGAVVETMPPGCLSSLSHWDLAEDAFIYMLEGEIVVHEGGTQTLLLPGQAVCFKAGVPAGHCLENRSPTDAHYLVVGSRRSTETVTYPDHDRILQATDGQPTRFTTLNGQPVSTSAYDLTAG